MRIFFPISIDENSHQKKNNLAIFPFKKKKKRFPKVNYTCCYLRLIEKVLLLQIHISIIIAVFTKAYGAHVAIEILS